MLLLKILSLLSQTRHCPSFTHSHHIPEDSTARALWFMHPPPSVRCFYESHVLFFFPLTSLFKWGRPLINSFRSADLPVSDRQPHATRIVYLQALNHTVPSWCSNALSCRNKQSVFKPSSDWDLLWLPNSGSFKVASDN